MMEYKGYAAKVEFDDENETFFGEVVNLRDVITFEGQTVSELKQAFHDSVEDYLAFCAERGEEPEKPYSGTLSLRMDPALHRQVATRAQLENKSINAWISEALASSVGTS